jgi:hypothetical protein
MKHLDKLFLSLLGLGLFIGHTAHAQLGVKLGGASPSTPQTSLDVNGAITSRPTTLTVTGNSATIPANVGQVVLVPASTGGPTADIALSLAAAPFPGQMLFVVNNTAQRALLNGVGVSAGQSMIFTGDAASSNFIGASDNLGNHTATQTLNLQGNALTGTGSTIGTTVGLGVRADGGLNIGQNTSGNVFLGYQAGQATTPDIVAGTGIRNQFNGYQSGLNNTTGYYNLFIGHQSGRANTTGRSNLFFGVNSGLANTTGQYNLFMGTNSGQNSTASDNLFFGHSSGSANTTGSNNLFMGTNSGVSNLTGSYNIFLGTESGKVNTAANNLFIGYRSGYFNTTGGNNAFSGYQSSYNNTTGSNNTTLGYQSGYNITTGGNNTALGYQAGPPTGSGALTNTTAIGYLAQVTQSNSLILGGTGTAAVSVGVGTTAPQSTLEVNGSFAANYLNVTTAAYSLLPTDFYVVYSGTGASTFTLPTGVGVQGRLYTIKNTTVAQTLTVNVPAGEGINGSTSLTVPAGQSMQLITSGASAANTATYEIVSFGAATGGLAGGSSKPATAGSTVAAAASDYFVVPQTALTYTLPSPASNPGRVMVLFAKGGVVTVTSVAGLIFSEVATSAGAATYSLAQLHRITFISDGTNWIATAYI